MYSASYLISREYSGKYWQPDIRSYMERRFGFTVYFQYNYYNLQ